MIRDYNHFTSLFVVSSTFNELTLNEIASNLQEAVLVYRVINGTCLCFIAGYTTSTAVTWESEEINIGLAACAMGVGLGTRSSQLPGATPSQMVVAQ